MGLVHILVPAVQSCLRESSDSLEYSYSVSRVVQVDQVEVPPEHAPEPAS